MKKQSISKLSISILTMAFCLVFVSVALPKVAAQDTGGRESVQFDQPTSTTPQATSGFQDENGNPISIEEYNKIREHESKNIIAREPVASAVVVALIVGAIYYFTVYRKKGAKRS